MASCLIFHCVVIKRTALACLLTTLLKIRFSSYETSGLLEHYIKTILMPNINVLGFQVKAKVYAETQRVYSEIFLMCLVSLVRNSWLVVDYSVRSYRLCVMSTSPWRARKIPQCSSWNSWEFQCRGHRDVDEHQTRSSRMQYSSTSTFVLS